MQDTDPVLLMALHKVPHLAHVCADMQVLKELRSICTETRPLSTGRIAGISVDFSDVVSSMQRLSLVSVLSTSRLRRLCVVLHLESHGRMEQDLTGLAACLQQPLSSVTQLSIQLRGVDTGEFQNPLIVAAAMAVRIMGPCCGPLTHITVSGEVRTWAENTYTLLLDAASAVCAPSLTHLSFSMQAKCFVQQLRPGEEDEILECGCDFLIDITACEALASFKSLTHLRLEHGSVCDEPVWSSLPASLQGLDFRSPYVNLPDCRVLQNLHTLSMQQCDCYDLAQLLKACPLLKQLHVVELYTPTCVEEQADLAAILQHPVWCANNGGGSHCTPVTRLHQGWSWDDTSHLAPWVVLAALPVMPTILDFRLNFMDGQEGQHLFVDPVRLLHHIPRLFPHVERLCLERVLLLDSDLTELHACSSLWKLDLRESDDVTADALLALVVALPKLTWVEVTRSKCLSAAHTEEIAAVVNERGGKFRESM